MEDLAQTNPKKTIDLKKKTPIITTIGTAMESTVSILWTQSFISYENSLFSTLGFIFLTHSDHKNLFQSYPRVYLASTTSGWGNRVILFLLN